MRITYVGFGDFHRYAGMKQLYHFAQEVCRQGHAAQILIAGSATTVASMEEPPEAEIVEMAFTGPRLAQIVRRQVLAFGPDILHVWTPRYVPALAGWQLWRATGARLIVDHEDDEDYHVRSFYRATMVRWRAGARRLAAPLAWLRAALGHWVAPVRSDGAVARMAKEPVSYHRVTRLAKAHTAISPNLTAWAESQWPDVPVHLLYPGADLQLFGSQVGVADLRSQLGLAGRRIVAYSGAMSLEIFHWLFAALAGLAIHDPQVTLLLVGDDHFRAEAEQAATEYGLQANVRLIGRVPYAEVPGYLALADVLVQHPLDQGNRYRLPAKLPEYLAMGRPVVTFAQGIGETFEDGTHVRKLYTTEPMEATQIIGDLLEDPQQRANLGHAARRMACERFSWSRNSAQLIRFYEGNLEACASYHESAYSAEAESSACPPGERGKLERADAS